jgi:hypothetical protein
VKYLNYLDGMINDIKCTREIKSRIIMAKAAFKKKKTIFISKLDLNLRNERVKCYNLHIALYGAETSTLRKTDQKCLKSTEMWCGKKKDRIKEEINIQ